MIPIGSEMSIQRIAPPKTSDAVTGAARHDDVVHVLPVDERRAERLVPDELPEKAAVLLVDGLVEVQALCDLLRVRRASRPGRRPAAPDRTE